MIVAGIGCRRNAPANAIEAAIAVALSECGLARSALDALASSAEKRNEPGLQDVARKLSLPLILVEKEALEAASGGALTKSERVLALKGVPSIAETAALAAAGRGARLVVARVSNPQASCAIAIGEGQ